MKLLCLGFFVSVSAALAFQVQPPTGTNARFSRSAPKLAVVNIAETVQRDVMSMDDWAIACGVQRCEGFQLASEDGLDYGAITATDLPAESPVLYVPNEMILSSNQAMYELGRIDASEKRLVSGKVASHIPHFYLFLKILLEFEKGEDSPWFPWLDSMPRYYSNGASMTPFCFECLPPLVGYLAMNDRIRFIQFFQALKFVDFLSDYTKGNKELAKWAFAVVHTRCFETDDGVKLVPMADMFNHGNLQDTEVDISWDEQGNCYAYSKYDVPGGYPLRMSYGDHTNPSALFARYGFLDETSPATFCKIMVKNPSQRLKNMGYDHSKLLFYKDTGDVSEEVWDVLLYQNLADDPEQQEAFYNAHVSGDYNTKQQYHQHYFQETLGALREHVDTFLLSLDELTAKADGRDINEHPRLPLILAHNNFVRETFLKVKANLDNM